MNVLKQIAEWITGNEWKDWKTRLISPSHLLIQREINRYLFETPRPYNGTILFEVDLDYVMLYRYPTYDDVATFDVDELTKEKVLAVLEEAELEDYI